MKQDVRLDAKAKSVFDTYEAEIGRKNESSPMSLT